MPLDRTRLYSALHLKENKNELFYLVNTYEFFVWQKFHIDKVGDLSIPLEKNKINILRDIYAHKPQRNLRWNQFQDFCSVPSNNIDLHCQEQREWKDVLGILIRRTMEKMLEIDLGNLNCNIEAHLDNLILCENGQSCEAIFNSSKDLGTFGKLLVKLPINDAVESGTMTINYGDQQVTFDFNEKAKLACFHVAAITAEKINKGKQTYSITSTSQGAVVVLTFNLIWMDVIDPLNVQPTQFSKFFLSAHRVHLALIPWISSETISRKSGKTEAPEHLMKNSLNADFFCIPLLSSYRIREFKRAKLSQQDAHLLGILKSINYIDTKLAIATSSHGSFQLKMNVLDNDTSEMIRLIVWQDESFCHETLKVRSYETDIEQESVELPEVKLNTHLVGNITAEIVDFPDSDVENGVHHHPVLIITKRWTHLKRVEVNVAHALKDLIQRSKEAIVNFIRGDSRQHKRWRNDVNILISILRDFPVSTETCFTWWPVPTLLQLCVEMHLVDESLALVNLLSQKCCLCGSHDFLLPRDGANLFYENVDKNGNGMIESLFELITVVSDWHQCAESMVRLINSRESVIPVSYGLAERLYYAEHNQEAYDIASAILAQLKRQDLNETNGSDHLFRDLRRLCSYLLNDQSPGNLEKLSSFLKYFNPSARKSTSQLWKDIFDAKLLLCNEGIEYYNAVVRKMEPLLSEQDLECLNIETFIEAIKKYSELRENELLKSLWKKVVKEASICQSESRQSLLERLIISVDNDMERKTLIKTIFLSGCTSQVIEAIFISLNRDLNKIRNSEPTSNMSEILKRIESYFCFMASIESFLKMSNLEGSGKGSVKDLCTVNIDRLVHILEDLRKNHAARFKKCNDGRKVYHLLLDEILSNDVTAVLKLNHFTKLFSCYLWFEDIQLIQSVVHSVCETADKADANIQMRIISSILKMEGIFGDRETWMSLDSICINKLIQSWTGLIPLMIVKEEGERKSEVIDCFSTLVQYEVLNPAGPDEELVNSFSLLTGTFNNVQELKQFVLFIYHHGMLSPGLKQFPFSFKVYKQFCLHFVNLAEFEEVLLKDLGDVKSVLLAFLWLGEELPLVKLVNTIKKISSDEFFNKSSETDNEETQPIALADSIVTCEETHELAVESACGFKAFNDLIDYYKDWLTLKIESQYVWSIPDATVAKCKDIENFLRSNERSMNYGAYRSRGGISKLLARINLDPSWNIESRIIQLSSSLFSCELTKNRRVKSDSQTGNHYEMFLSNLNSLQNNLTFIFNQRWTVAKMNEMP